LYDKVFSLIARENYLYMQGLSLGSINRIEFILESYILFRNFSGLFLSSVFYF